MLTLIFGGGRSGKSRLAQPFAEHAVRVAYVAAYRSGNDPEMAVRIERHGASRPAAWQIVQEPLPLNDQVEQAGRK